MQNKKATKTFHLRHKSENTLDFHLHIGRTRTGTRVTLEYDGQLARPDVPKLVRPVDPDKPRAQEMFEKGANIYQVAKELNRDYNTIQYWRKKWAVSKAAS